MSLRSYVAKEVSRLLKIGQNIVSLLSTIDCTSFDEVKLIDGELKVVGRKDKQFEWLTPTPQICLLIVGENGSLVHRMSEEGYVAWTDLTPEEQASGKYVEVQGYACKQTKKGLDRIVSPTKTATCANMISKFLFAVNGQAGDVDIDACIATKKQFIAVVARDQYQGEEHLIVSEFKPLVKASTNAPSDLEA